MNVSDAGCGVESNIDSGPTLAAGTWTAVVAARRTQNGPQPCTAGFSDWFYFALSFTDMCTLPETMTGEGCSVPPEPFDCSDFIGMQVDRYYADTAVGGAVCASAPGSETPGEECGASPVGFASCAGGECFARLEFSGGTCEGGAADVTGEDLADEPGNMNCVSGGGVTICAGQNAQNCGTVNGEPLCLTSVPEGRCTFLGDGGMVCASTAGAPPAPTDSAGTSPATPDATFTARSEGQPEDTDYDVFGPGTVQGSGTATSGTASTEDETPEEPGECTEVGSCPGNIPELGEAETIAESTGTFMGAVNSAPIVQAITGLATSMPAGVCPAPQVTLAYLNNATFTLDAHCALWENIAGVLTFVMLAVWVFIGARIILSA